MFFVIPQNRIAILQKCFAILQSKTRALNPFPVPPQRSGPQPMFWWAIPRFWVTAK